MLLRIWALLLLSMGVMSGAWAQASLSAQQAEAQKQRAELQRRIAEIQKQIESTQSDKKQALTALRDVESRISDTDRELTLLQQRQTQVQKHLADLKQQIQQQQQKQEQGQQQLAEQLRAQYASGLSPWTALLSGKDPQQIQRELGYLGYVTQAQTEQVRVLQQGLAHLQQLHAAVASNEKELAQLAAQTEVQKQQFMQQQAEREKVLAQVQDQLKQQQTQAKTLANNDVRLGQLIDGLEKEIARQAELRRQAEIRRQAEQARRRAEEQRRQAEQAQRLAEEKKRQAEAAQRLAQQREQQAQETQALAAVEQEAARKAEDARWQALAHTPAQPAVPVAPPPPPPPPKAPAPPPAVEPERGFAGLKRGLTPPVRGETLGRFGAERPEGGPWRGVVFRAPAGTPVKAISAGRVVFANWMSGFGNLLIIDHGAGFLSVYGNNQSVLKQVGDVVRAGEAIARVGATGGQVEPGVYFEIRQNGQPVNPLIWLGN